MVTNKKSKNIKVVSTLIIFLISLPISSNTEADDFEASTITCRPNSYIEEEKSISFSRAEVIVTAEIPASISPFLEASTKAEVES